MSCIHIWKQPLLFNRNLSHPATNEQGKIQITSHMHRTHPKTNYFLTSRCNGLTWECYASKGQIAEGLNGDWGQIENSQEKFLWVQTMQIKLLDITMMQYFPQFRTSISATLVSVSLVQSWNTTFVCHTKYMSISWSNFKIQKELDSLSSDNYQDKFFRIVNPYTCMWSKNSPS